MKVMFALAERRGYPVDRFYPELLAAVDEGTHDEDPSFYGHEIERARHRRLDPPVQIRHFEVDVPDSVIRDAFGASPVTVDAPVRHVEPADEVQS